MSSVSESLARNIAANNGIYVADNGASDPQCFAVFRIKNRYFGHEHYVVAYTFEAFFAYALDHQVTEILWSINRPKIDAALEEIQRELL